MNRTLLLSAGFLFAAQTQAQTLDQTTQATTIGSSYIYRYSNVYLEPSTTTGPDQVWDYSDAVPARTDTVLILDPAETPLGASYPNAQYAEYHSEHPYVGGDPFTGGTNPRYYRYWANAASGQFCSGEMNYFMQWERYAMPQARKEVQFPLSLTHGWSGTTQGSAAPFEGWGEGTVSCGLNVVADASGTLILPSGTFTDVLRVHRLRTVTYSYDGEVGTGVFTDDADEYAFYQAGMPVPLMVTSLWGENYWSEYFEVMTTGLMDAARIGPTVDVWPTMTSDMLSVTVGADEASTISVVNNVGCIIHPVLDQVTAKSGRTYRFSTSDLASGMYHVKVRFGSGGVVTRKFIVVR